MAQSAMFFETFKQQMMLSINTSLPCRVLSYDKERRMATVQPLFQMKEVGQNPQNMSIIEDVPVLWQRYEVQRKQPIDVSIKEGAHTHSGGEHSQYSGNGSHSHTGGAHEHTEMRILEELDMVPVLKAGDVVLAVCAQRALDDALDGKPVYAGTSRILSVQDAVIVGIF